ncbi:hypothetical protein IFM89_022974 [Coptis chinensis]|uniref:Uncharacterized protein n=1 Tax=Coptis chinensis TaxID=261450 RepID=A0A835M0Q2_9MAGN|nr:hypothetical protein IFM89_022974 [Coptis chinensis]
MSRLQMPRTIKKDLYVFKGSQQTPILDPVISETKGRPKGGTRKEKANNNERWKPVIEIASNKNKRKCVLCKSTQHDRRRCPSKSKAANELIYAFALIYIVGVAAVGSRNA